MLLLLLLHDSAAVRALQLGHAGVLVGVRWRRAGAERAPQNGLQCTFAVESLAREEVGD